MPLSGKFRFRKAAFGKLVLQIEELRKPWPWSAHFKPRWRDAKVLDLAATELRQLIDLSNGRLLMPRTVASTPLRHPALGPAPQGAQSAHQAVPDVGPGATQPPLGEVRF